LPSPLDHRYKERPSPDDKIWDRLGCELWIGCRPGIRIESFCGVNTWVASGRTLYRLLAAKRHERYIEEGLAQPFAEPIPNVRFARHEAFTRRLQNPKSALARFAK
jgi:hypothetical protein